MSTIKDSERLGYWNNHQCGLINSKYLLFWSSRIRLIEKKRKEEKEKNENERKE